MSFNLYNFISYTVIYLESSVDINIFKYLIVASSIFTIVPETQYVYLNDNVTFECATNLTGYSLEFIVKKHGSTQTIGLEVIRTDLPGGGEIATASFVVTAKLNGTSIRCIADNKDNKSESPIVSSFAYVYAQG